MNRKLIYIDNFLTQHGRTPTSGVAMVDLFKKEGYNIVYASKINNRVLRLLDMLLLVLKNRKNSVALIATYSTQAFYFAYLCGWLCRLLKIPYIPKLHGGDLPGRIKRSPGMCRRYFGKSVVNVAVSGYLEVCMRENGWNCTVISNYIRIASYPFKQRTHCSPKLLWVRSFHIIYNPWLALKLLKELLKQYPDAQLTMIGPDKDGCMGSCKLYAKEAGITEHVHFTGLLGKPEWTALAAEHDIFINTSNFDNLPVSVMEAMALGMAVVSTDVGGVKYLVTDNENGLVVAPDNLEEMLKAVKRFLHDDSLTQSLSLAAGQKAKEYDYEAVSAKWKKLLAQF
ncbi:glycosyltransferase family 4 protein [Foetidibacter luteolus]|uniref:glycosyltransferase family 4 protein n=1 Tax=Foetidibacter luteolus TaxID=2608880 RepID=UPI00129B53B7|nr:glycosyltransferase family 4 protein [Foetidibacter luteolus]